jgi:hypothetical protein
VVTRPAQSATVSGAGLSITTPRQVRAPAREVLGIGAEDFPDHQSLSKSRATMPVERRPATKLVV